jgi:hypothetical protein
MIRFPEKSALKKKRSAQLHQPTGAETLQISEILDVFKRLCGIGDSSSDPLTRDFYLMMAAWEVLKRRKYKNYKIVVGKYPRAIKEGIVPLLQRWTDSKTAAVGFTELVEAGFPELTGEYLVLRYSNLFPDRTVRNAKARYEGAKRKLKSPQ